MAFVSEDTGDIRFPVPTAFLSTFAVGPEKPRATKPPVAHATRLPFGLAPVVKPRSGNRKRQQRNVDSKPRKKRVQEVVGEMDSDIAACDGDDVASADDNDSDTDAAAVLSSGSVAGSGHSEQDVSEEDCLDGNGGGTVLSSGAKREFEDALRLSHAVFDSVPEPDQDLLQDLPSQSCEPTEGSQRPEAGEPSSSSRAGPTVSRAPGPVRFQASVGILGISEIKRKGARCLHCQASFEKGEIRLEFASKTNKPSRSLHPTCMAQLPDSFVPQALKFLEDAQAAIGSTEPKKKQACVDALKILRSVHGQASESR